MDGAQADREAALHAPQSRGAGLGAGTGAAAVEQLSELCFRRSGRGANQSVGQDKDENPAVGSMNSHLYKKRKGGPATTSRTGLARAKDVKGAKARIRAVGICRFGADVHVPLCHRLHRELCGWVNRVRRTHGSVVKLLHRCGIEGVENTWRRALW